MTEPKRRGRPPKNKSTDPSNPQSIPEYRKPMPSGRVPFQEGVEVRKMTEEERAKYGDPTPRKDAAVGFKKFDSSKSGGELVTKTSVERRVTKENPIMSALPSTNDNIALDGVEWFEVVGAAKQPTIGFHNSGQFVMNKEAVELMKVEIGSRVQIGLTADKKHIMIRKSEKGVKLRGQSGDSTGLRSYSSNMVKWLKSNGMDAKRYVIQKHVAENVFIAKVKS